MAGVVAGILSAEMKRPGIKKAAEVMFSGPQIKIDTE
jgi:hypothetical protein